MSVDDRENRLDEQPDEKPADTENQVPSGATRPPRRRRRYITRRSAFIVLILAAAGTVALVLLLLLVYRLGFVDSYVAGQIKNTFANYGIRAEIKEFHTGLTPQTVEMLGLELYDGQTGDKLAKI